MKARPYTTKTRRKIISRTGPIGSSPNESVSAAVPLHVREMLKKVLRTAERSQCTSSVLNSH